MKKRILLPFLKTGVMLACFHSLGSLPKRNDLLNIKHNALASSFAHSLRILGCRISGPGVLLGLTLCRADNTSSVETSKVDMISLVKEEVGGPLGIDVSLLKTEVKYVFNASAFVVVSE